MSGVFLMEKMVSIRKALLSSVILLTLVPMLTAVTLSVVMFHLDTSKRIRLENQRVAQTVATAVELFLSRPVVLLQHIRDDVQQYAESHHAGGGFGTLSTIMQTAMEIDPLFESVLLVDAAGRLAGAAGPEGYFRKMP